MSEQYRDAGVDITAGYQAVNQIKSHVKRTMRKEVIGGLGGFGAAFDLSGDLQRPAAFLRRAGLAKTPHGHLPEWHVHGPGQVRPLRDRVEIPRHPARYGQELCPFPQARGGRVGPGRWRHRGLFGHVRSKQNLEYAFLVHASFSSNLRRAETVTRTLSKATRLTGSAAATSTTSTWGRLRAAR